MNQEAKELGILEIGPQRGALRARAEDAYAGAVAASVIDPVNPMTGVNEGLEREAAINRAAIREIRKIDNSYKGKRLNVIRLRVKEIDQKLAEIAAGR